MPLKLNKKNLSLIITAILIILAYFIDGNPEEKNPVIINQSITTSTASEQVAGDKIVPLDSSEIAENQNESIENDEFFPVVKIIDGDTFEVTIDNQIKKVRLIGVNTPETVDPRRAVQCFGQEASDYLKQLLIGHKVKLASDTSQGEYDKYGRMLVYVWREDGAFVNLELISKGYAYEYTYKTPYLYQADFKLAQEKAIELQLGLWSPTNCNGQK